MIESIHQVLDKLFVWTPRDLVVNNFLLWIALLPLIGAFINGFFGKRLPAKLVPLIACGSVGLAARAGGRGRRRGHP